MELDYRNATIGDLAKVFRNNDERLTAEYNTAGFNQRAVKDMFRDWISEGSAHSLTVGDKPVAIIAWQMHDGMICTSFAATPEFFDRKFIRFCRSHIRTIQAAHQNASVVANSYGTHSHLSRWFALLGFQPGEPEELSTPYILPPSNQA